MAMRTGRTTKPTLMLSQSLMDGILKEKGSYLVVSLRCQAQIVFGNLTSNSSKYEGPANAQERFAPPNQMELYRVQLKERRQQAAEALTELDQDIWRLTNLVYPRAPSDVDETLAKEQLIDSLHSSDMRLRIKQARPTSLNQEVRRVVEPAAFNKAEKRHEKKVREKSRECHNHKPQPFPDPKRKRSSDSSSDRWLEFSERYNKEHS